MTSKDNMEPTRQAVLKMLERGLASPAEVAELAGVSRQLCNFWIKAAGINWRQARAAWLAKSWRQAVR